LKRSVTGLAALAFLAACTTDVPPSNPYGPHGLPQTQRAAYCQGSGEIRITPCPVLLKNARGIAVTVSGPHVRFAKPGAGCNDVCFFKKVSDTKWKALPGYMCGTVEAQFTALNAAKHRLGFVYLKVTNQHCEDAHD
jgi:hypothetical protein